jgi:exodeoxyribonuclease VII large subunit
MNKALGVEKPIQTPPVLSVSALNQAVAQLLERSFPLTWVVGEISNFTRAASGHWYFTLKDEGAQVRAVMFRGRAQFAGFTPREGERVEVRALVSLYAARGDYQLSVETIRRSGLGNLYEAFLQLKARLEAEGLFESVRKRPVALFARSVGIVTSPQAAALRDILTTLQRRAPHVRVVLYPAPVQGPGAGQKIAQAISTASARAECDVLLVCRGGGSIEDLWSFNEETVARAIVASSMPVIVGVGHETDFTIADFAADLRAPTPTAAAEMAVAPRQYWQNILRAHVDDLRRTLRRSSDDSGQRLDWLARRLVSPGAHIARERSRLRQMQRALLRAAHVPLEHARLTHAHMRARLARQWPDTVRARARLEQAVGRLQNVMQSRQQQRSQALAALASQLAMLDPQRTLERGYAIVQDAKGNVVRSPQQLRPAITVSLRLAEGSAEIGIASVQPRLD